MQQEYGNLLQENSNLKSRCLILYETIFEEQQRTIAEELKKRAAEEEVQIYKKKLAAVGRELLKTRSLLAGQTSPSLNLNLKSETKMDCSSDNDSEV